MFDMPLLIGTLGDHLSGPILFGALALIVVFRFRRYRMAAAAAVGAVSSAATIAVAVVVVLFGLVTLGYWDPPVGEMVADVLAAGRAVYDAVGERVIDATIGRLGGST